MSAADHRDELLLLFHILPAAFRGEYQREFSTVRVLQEALQEPHLLALQLVYLGHQPVALQLLQLGDLSRRLAAASRRAAGYGAQLLWLLQLELEGFPESLDELLLSTSTNPSGKFLSQDVTSEGFYPFREGTVLRPETKQGGKVNAILEGSCSSLNG